ncbi:MAG: CdaR family protein [Dissulfurispiraceae bacterium]|jgi:YbbR domain-containing protein
MRKILFSNPGIKIISVVLAVFIWIYVTYRGQAEIAIDATIGFKNVPKGMELLRTSAKSATLNLRGQERLLKSLRPMDLSVVVDLSNAKRGETTYYLDKNAVLAPGTVDILRVEPTSVRVVLDESVVKTLPVKASIAGAPDKGFKIVSVDVMPSSVTVRGAKSELSKIAVLRTETIDVTGFDTGLRETVRLNINGKNIKTATPEVTVSIAIKR